MRQGGKRGAFTLIELLVVIAIIGILVALVAGTAANVIRRAKETAIKTDLDQMTLALKAYKAKNGSYPPSDFTSDKGKAEVVRHLLSRYKRWQTPWTQQQVPELSQAQALVFWLQGLSENPQDPFDVFRPEDAYFQFEETRLLHPNLNQLGKKRFELLKNPDDPADDPADNSPDPRTLPLNPATLVDRVSVYVPPGDLRQPYIYFRAPYTHVDSSGNLRAKAYHINPDQCPTADQNNPQCLFKRPYRNSTTQRGIYPPEAFVRPKEFQLLSAGLDDDWGIDPNSSNKEPFGFYPTGKDSQGVQTYFVGDMDNLTNFSPQTLGDARP